MGMDYSIYKLSKKELMVYHVVSMVGLFIVGMIFYANIFLAAVLMFASMPIKKIYLNMLMRKRKNILLYQFKDLLASLDASFSTGRGMTESLIEAEKSMKLTYNEKDIIIKELEYLNKLIDKASMSVKDILVDFSKRSDLEDIITFFEVYYIAMEVGGDVTLVVKNAASGISDRIEIRRNINTMIIQKKYESIILFFIPIVVVLFLEVSSPDYLYVLQNTVMGYIIMTFLLGIMGIAFILSDRITNIEV